MVNTRYLILAISVSLCLAFVLALSNVAIVETRAQNSPINTPAPPGDVIPEYIPPTHTPAHPGNIDSKHQHYDYFLYLPLIQNG